MIQRLLFLLVLFLSGCALRPQPSSLQELEHFPQNFEAYTQNLTLPTETSVDEYRSVESGFFEPWHYENAPKTLEEILWPYRSYTKGVIYGANLQPLDTQWFEHQNSNSGFAAFDSEKKYAISVAFSHLKNFPTIAPLFRDPKEAGEGFPFDYNQNSAVHANEPLYVSHYSQDGAWVYVFTAYASGWLHVRDIALIPQHDAALWEHAKQVMLTTEHTPLHEREGNYLFDGRIGMMLPLIGMDSKVYYLLAAGRDPHGGISYHRVTLPLESGTLEPLPLEPDSIALIGNRLIGETYGWGGLYETRDCSSLLRDYFSVFGIWLPRNSYQQSQIGKVISLEGLNPKRKAARIIAEAVPFETLLYKRGHIMLYLGVYENQIMIFHDAWGVKTFRNGAEGRFIVGKSIISTLDFGSELESYESEAAILPQLLSMNIVTAKP